MASELLNLKTECGGHSDELYRCRNVAFVIFFSFGRLSLQ